MGLMMTTVQPRVMEALEGAAFEGQIASLGLAGLTALPTKGKAKGKGGPMRLTVKLLVACAATIGRVADALETFATRLDPHAPTREWVRDSVAHSDYLEEMDYLKAHADELDETDEVLC
jgi:hypothetical protein